MGIKLVVKDQVLSTPRVLLTKSLKGKKKLLNSYISPQLSVYIINLDEENLSPSRLEWFGRSLCPPRLKDIVEKSLGPRIQHIWNLLKWMLIHAPNTPIGSSHPYHGWSHSRELFLALSYDFSVGWVNTIVGDVKGIYIMLQSWIL